jgi:hypothetical protein
VPDAIVEAMAIEIRRIGTPRLLLLAAAVAVAGCGSGATSPAPPAASPPAATVVPVPTASDSPTTAPSQNEQGGPLAEALVAALAADSLVTHLEQVATVTSTGTGATTVEATLSADIDGDDVALALHVTTPQGEQSQELRVIGDAAYTLDEGVWRAVPRSVVQPSLASLLVAVRFVDDATALRDVGVESIGGRDLHHLTASRAIPYTPASGGTGQYERFDVWVEDDGTPVLVKTAFSAESNGTKASGTTDFEFSKFGGPIEIVAPSTEPG